MCFFMAHNLAYKNDLPIKLMLSRIIIPINQILFAKVMNKKDTELKYMILNMHDQ